MKRALIRMLGCIMSAIGLGMTYDTTIQILTDEVPGTAFAAADTGSGTGTSSESGGSTGCVYANGCVPFDSYYITSSSGNYDYCAINGEGVGYNIVLKKWYVGWPNKNYSSGGGNALYKKWPLLNDSYWERNLYYSGNTSDYPVVSGHFAGVGYPYGSTSGSALCSGSFTGIFEGNTCTSTGSYHNGAPVTCIASYGSLAGNIDVDGFAYAFSAVYMRNKDAFVDFGCAEADVYGTCDSASPCCYAPADREYMVELYWYDGLAGSTAESGYRSVYVTPLYEPIVLYYFTGCGNGYFANEILTGTAANFGVSALGNVFDIFSDTNPTACPSASYVSDNAVKLGNGVMGANCTFYSYGWNNCDECPTMSSITNYTDVTSFTARSAASDSGVGNTTCNKTVTNAVDDTGTFDFVGTCSYNE